MNIKKTKKIVAIILIIAIIVIGIFFINNKRFMKKIIKDEIIVEIENLKYNDGRKFKKIESEGYYIKKDGKIIEFDNIKGTLIEKNKIANNDLEKLIKLVEEIDEEKVITKMTTAAVLEGQIIVVYNTNKDEIILKDFYNDNYSTASNEIMKILSNNNLIEKIDNN